MKKLFSFCAFMSAAFVALAAAQTQPTGRIEGTVTLVVSLHDINYAHISGGHVYLIDATTSQGVSFLRDYQQQSDANGRINFVCEQASRFAAAKADLILSTKPSETGTATYSFDNVPILPATAANGAAVAYEVAGCVEYDYARMWTAPGQEFPSKDMTHAGISAFEQTVAQLQANAATHVSTVVTIGATSSEQPVVPSGQPAAASQQTAASQPVQQPQAGPEQTPVPPPVPPSAASEQSAASPPGNFVPPETRAITIDVLATAPHGGVIRDLKPGEFEISDNGAQKIEHFAFIDTSGHSTPKNSTGAPPLNGIYTNKEPFEGLAGAPTVVLLDALNTPSQNQPQARRYMIQLLKTLPPDTPVTVLLLGARVSLVQDFRSDPALLRAALQTGGSSSQLNPAAEKRLGNERLTEEAVSLKIGEFAKEQYTQPMRHRLDKTVDALEGIAEYLRGNPGRKNLIWVSSSFPIATIGDAYVQERINGIFEDASSLPAGPATKANVQRALDVLSSAQVAVYPMFAGGLQTETSKYPGGGNRGDAVSPGYMKQFNRDLIASSMDQLAEESGGKVCKNADDLSPCIAGAQNDSSSYYELSYYPANANWDGSFHKISIKTTRQDVELTYPHGYYAIDERAFAKQQPQEILEQTCRDLFPATGIRMSAQLLPQRQANTLAFRVAMPASLLGVAPQGSSRSLSAMLAACQYSETAEAINFDVWDLSQNLPGATYPVWRAREIDQLLNVPQASGALRVRLAVLDQNTGLTGAVDVPLPPEIVNGSGLPASPAPRALSFEGTSVSFSVASGKSATLDWSGSKLVYRGDLGVDKTAPAFFHDNFTAKFRCDAGKLAPRDAAGVAPDLQLTFTNAAGQLATVDLSGEKPLYSGTLTVDPSASAFFARLWYLCHCTSPQ